MKNKRNTENVISELVTRFKALSPEKQQRALTVTSEFIETHVDEDLKEFFNGLRKHLAGVVEDLERLKATKNDE